MNNWYKNYKFAGYVKPNEDIVNYIYGKVGPFVEAVWVNNRIKQLKSICKRIDICEKNEAECNNLSKIYYKNKDFYRNRLRQFMLEMREKIGGISNEIYSFDVPIDIVCRTVDCEAYINDVFSHNLPKLTCKIFMKGNRHGGFNTESEGEFGSKGVISIYPYKIMDDFHNSNFKAAMSYSNECLNRLLNDTKTVIGHELIHFMQEYYDLGIKDCNSYFYGLPSNSMGNAELTTRVYDESSAENKKRIHPLLDYEFYPRIFDEISMIKRLIDANGDIDLPLYIKRSHFLNTLKLNNTDKYEKAIKEIYKEYNSLQNNRKT